MICQLNATIETRYPTWKLISALQHKSKYESKFNLELFWKKNQIFGFPCCST